MLLKSSLSAQFGYFGFSGTVDRNGERYLSLGVGLGFPVFGVEFGWLLVEDDYPVDLDDPDDEQDDEVPSPEALSEFLQGFSTHMGVLLGQRAGLSCELSSCIAITLTSPTAGVSYGLHPLPLTPA